MSTVIVVIGEGGLADCVSAELSGRCQVIRRNDCTAGVPAAAHAALVLDDAWRPAVHRLAEEALQSAGIPWLRGFVSFGEGVVGPLVRPGTPGCSRCADKRMLMGGRDRREMWGLEQRLAAGHGVSRDVWATRTGLLHMSHLLAAEALKMLQGGRALSEERMYRIDLKTLATTRHFILPDAQCPVCGSLPDDSPSAARITLQPRPKRNADSYRSRPLEELKQALVGDYLDYRTGFMNGKMADLVSPFADVSVNLPMFNGDEGVAGRTHSYAASELTAILEGLERYCGIAPGGKRTVIRDSYRNVADRALDPVTVGVHAKEQYERPGFPFEPFDPDRAIDWVWGYSFGKERPILVPELLAYYSMGCGHGFVYETSNGCALGGSLEEAVLYGILEAVERDSFLLTWYAQLPLPRLDLDSANDRELRLMVDRVRAVAGYDIILFNSTMEHGIPSVWAIAKNTRSKGVNLICAAGAHPDPMRAVKSTIHELSGMLLTLDEKFAKNREEYARMLHDPFLVRDMDDHSMLYALPEAEERLQFLLDANRPLRPFDEEFRRKAPHDDLTDDLKDIIRAIQRSNLDVIVVNQTTPETERNGLYCVKVLIPGMLPMTFGHHLARVTGLGRVMQVPVQLGYAKGPLTAAQLNPHPHPFP